MVLLLLSASLNLLRITLSRVTLKRSPIGSTKRSLRSGDQTDLRQVSKSVRSRQYSSPRVSLSVPVRDIRASHVLSLYCLLVQLAAPTTSCPRGQKSNNTLVKLSVTEINGSIWHSPSKGPLSHPFRPTVCTQNLVPTNARGGPSSRFSQFLELCVVTRNFRSTWVPDYPNVPISGACLVCVILPTGYPDLGTYYPDAHVTANLLVCFIFLTG